MSALELVAVVALALTHVAKYVGGRSDVARLRTGCIVLWGVAPTEGVSTPSLMM